MKGGRHANSGNPGRNSIYATDLYDVPYTGIIQYSGALKVGFNNYEVS